MEIKMICSNCGKEIKDDSVFCPECGTKVASPKPEQPVITEPAKDEIGFMAQNQEQEPSTGAEKHFEPAGTTTPPAEAGYIPPAGIPAQPAAGQYPYMQQSYRPSAPPAAYQPMPVAVPDEHTVSTGIYVLMLIVGAIPLVGLVTHIIALTATKSRSFKNYCRAYVILGIICLVIALAAAVIGYIMFEDIQEFLKGFNIEVEKLF